MRKYLGLTLLIVLIPLWAVLYLMGAIGYVGLFLWENIYESVYRMAGKPLDRKG